MTVSIWDKIKSLFKIRQYHSELEHIKQQSIDADNVVENLERRATVNGDEGWFLDYVKKDPSCALKVLRECDKSGGG